MIDLYTWTTPNGHKVSILLEELGLPYRLKPVNLLRGEQFEPDFLRIAPNNRIPALVDHAPAGGGAPLAIFESGAILLYLAEKTGRFLPAELRARHETLQWLFWQMAGLGPMAGQAHHFLHAASESLPYAIERYVQEATRLYGVLDRRLADRPHVAGEALTIADFAIHPWVAVHARHRLDLADFPNVRAWFERLAARPALRRAYARAGEISPGARSPLPDPAPHAA